MANDTVAAITVLGGQIAGYVTGVKAKLDLVYTSIVAQTI